MRSHKFLILVYLLAVLAQGCASDPREAAARAGDPGALNKLCYGYLYGKLGYDQDYGRALKWCRLGAETGNSNDETLYAEIYYEGHGVKKDVEFARTWYKKAGDQGHRHAEYMMAKSELDLADPNYKKYCFWIAQAKEQAYDKAMALDEDVQKKWTQSHPGEPPLCDGVDLNTEPL